MSKKQQAREEDRKQGHSKFNTKVILQGKMNALNHHFLKKKFMPTFLYFVSHLTCCPKPFQMYVPFFIIITWYGYVKVCKCSKLYL